MKKLKIKRILTLIIAAALAALRLCTPVYAAENGYDYLLMPTQILKIAGTYYIVDCNHNQIIYSNSLNTELRHWNVMTRNTKSPHALTSDGEIYMAADTDNNRILTFSKSYDSFSPLEVFENVGIRPHYVDYDYDAGQFYAWSSMTGEMYIYERIPGTKSLALAEIRAIPELNGCYVRSFTLLGDVILFPAVERSSIVAVDKRTFAIVGEYPVPEAMAGMVQVSVVDGYFFVTVSTDRWYNSGTATVIRAKSLEDIAVGNYTSLYSVFGNNGTPYYISRFDGSYYMIHENAAPNVYRFHAQDGNIFDVKGMF